MILTNSGPVNEGDWVSGTTVNDERFIGYADSSVVNGTLKVRVTECDHVTIKGTTVEVKLAKVKKLPDSQPSSLLELQALIELALTTRDKEWFDELSGQLHARSATQQERSSPAEYTPMRGSRLQGLL